MKWERPREAALKVMPSTTGVAKSGSKTEPHGTADKKSGSKVAPFRSHRQRKIKNFSLSLIFFAFP
jgi:hypothetical protein